MDYQTPFERQFKQTKSQQICDSQKDRDDDFIEDQQDYGYNKNNNQTFHRHDHFFGKQKMQQQRMSRQNDRVSIQNNKMSKQNRMSFQNNRQQQRQYDLTSPAVKYQNYHLNNNQDQQNRRTIQKEKEKLYKNNKYFNNKHETQNQKQNQTKKQEQMQFNFQRKIRKDENKQLKPRNNKNNQLQYQKINENLDKTIKLAWLYKYLEQVQIQNDDYIKINICSIDFCPIFRVNRKQKQSFRNSKSSKIINFQDQQHKQTKKQNYQGKNNNQAKSNSANNYELRLSGGSQIFLKHEYISKFNMQKIKHYPSFQSLYVQINVPGRGLLVCSEQHYHQMSAQKHYKIMFQQQQTYQNVWRCQMINWGKSEQKSDLNAYLVMFVNLKYEKVLCINEKGNFYIDESINQFKFILRQKHAQTKQHSSNQYYLQPYGLLKSNTSNSKIPSYESNKMDNRHTSRIQVQIIELDDGFISTQQQIQYINQKLSENPSFQLIQIIFQLLIPYSIQQFIQNSNIISNQIKEVFIDDKISQMILDFLLKQFEQQTSYTKEIERIDEADQIQELDMSQNQESIKKSEQFLSNQTISNKKMSKKYQNQQNNFNRIRSSSKKQSIYNESSITRIFDSLNILCKNSQQNSNIFIALIDILFKNVLFNYDYIIKLIKGNIFFTNLFYKKKWYHILVKELMSFKQEEISIQNLTPYFLVFQGFVKAQDNCSKQFRPNLVNQLLLFHTLINPEFQQKNITLNIYVEGVYIFIHENQLDMELRTYMQSSKKQKLSSSQIQNIQLRKTNTPNKQDHKLKKKLNLYRQSIISNKLFKRSTMRYSSNQRAYQALKTVIVNIDFIGSLSHGYNLNILKHYERLINTLFSYCYKSSFPIIKNIQFKRSIMRLVNCFLIIPSEVKLCKRYRIGVVDIPHNKNIQKNPTAIKQFTLLNQHNQNKKCPQVSIKDIKQMSFIFLTKCQQFYSNLKKKTIKIQELFHIKLIDNEPIQENFDVLFYIFKNKLLKTKQRKKAQFMKYIQKIFQTLQTNVKQFNQQNNSMTKFVHLLQQIIKHNPSYENYSKYLKVKTSYQHTLILQQKLFSKKNMIKHLNIFRSQNQISKIAMIQLFNISQKSKQIETITRQRSGALHRPISTNLSQPLFKVFERDTINQPYNITKKQQSVKQKTKNQHNIGNSNASLLVSNSIESSRQSKKEYIGQTNFYQINQQKTVQNLKLQTKAVQLLSLICLNINQEYLEESVETLNYFIKNPTIFNLSSFELFQSIPKYFNQSITRIVILQQWYLSSYPQHFQSLTNLLRIFHTKVSEHLINLKAICILDGQQTADFYESISQIIEQLKKLSSCCASWMKQQLYPQYPNPFLNLQQNLRSICASLKSSFDFKKREDIETCLNLKKILLNLDIITIFKLLLNQILNQLKLLKKKKKKFNPSHKQYKKKLLKFCSQIKQVLMFFVKEFQIHAQNVQNIKMSKEQFEQNLKYCQAVFCFLSDCLSETNQLAQILIYILKISRKWCGYNFTVHFSDKILTTIFNDFFLFCKLIKVWIEFDQVQIIVLADAYSNYLLKIDEQIDQQIINFLTITKSEEAIADTNNQNLRLNQKQNLIDYQLSFFCFIFKIKKIQKKINFTSNKLHILKWFDQKILINMLFKDDNEEIQSLKYSKKLKYQECSLNIQRIILRKRFIAYFIDIFLYSEYGLSKLSIRLNQDQESNIQTVTKYIQQSLIQNTLFSKIQKLISQEQNFQKQQTKQKNMKQSQQKNKQGKQSSTSKFQQLFIAYLEYYVYDLCSLISNLKLNYQIYDKVSLNLNRLHQKLIFFLQNSDKERYYSKGSIKNLLEQLQEKQIISRMKSPREPIIDSFLFNENKQGQIQNKLHKIQINNIKFLQRKDLKKIKSIARRKWQKAIKALQEGALNTQTQFLTQIQDFAQIYNIKSQQSISIIINNQDLMRKLVHTAFNYNKLLTSTQNKIFILNQVRKFINTKTCTKLLNRQQTLANIAVRIIETFSNQLKSQISQSWSQNIFIICLKLRIISQCKYFQHQYTLSDLEIILKVLKKARLCFWGDQLKIRLSISEYKDLYYPQFILYNPLIQIFQILGQIDLFEIGKTQAKALAEQLHKCILQNKVNHKNLNNGALYKQIVDKLLMKFKKQQKSKLFHQVWNQIPKSILYQTIESLQKIKNV